MTEDVVRALGLLCLGTHLKRLGERLQSETDTVIAARGLAISASQYPYLACLDRLGPLTLGELAEAVGVSQPGATRTVNALVGQGVLAAEPAPDDQRRKIVALSAEGRRLVAIGRAEIWPRIAAAVGDLCADLDGPILDQLNAIEDRLRQKPLAERAPPPSGKD
ncbi:MarR family winged helix-turn-helix transcriptional regulator [Jiella sonneratiae]|uniref:MarR family transcriptional regulator n=1 Tax=Jiella sonneratiae TaxID=2816856 RepID=A0ABS3J7A1_9HYPH|nr:MarR family transcriptional regulator [Jiella sonneratiae]MBO0905517.1 MarR family transcriptional regulator [Jiella sonneratiae]